MITYVSDLFFLCISCYNNYFAGIVARLFYCFLSTRGYRVDKFLLLGVQVLLLFSVIVLHILISLIFPCIIISILGSTFLSYFQRCIHLQVLLSLVEQNTMESFYCGMP
jgi:hypothetical protein